MQNKLEEMSNIDTTQSYIGCKIIRARTMSLGTYNEYRGWIIPANEDSNREGYFIQYPDGYISWSPKEIFEESYRLISKKELKMI